MRHQTWIRLSNRSSAARSSARRSFDAGASTVTFEGLSAGTYAVAACHDENANGDCDTNFLGIPTEGVALVGPPSFAKARFALGAKPQSIAIHLDYQAVGAFFPIPPRLGILGAWIKRS